MVKDYRMMTFDMLKKMKMLKKPVRRGLALLAGFVLLAGGTGSARKS